MEVRQVINAINEVMRDTHTERTQLAIASSLRPISVYGPVAAIRKSGDSFPFQVRIQEGPDVRDWYWVNMGEMPDWKEVLAGCYLAVVCQAGKKKAAITAKCINK